MKVGKKQIYIIVLELCAFLCSALYLGLYGSSLTFAKYSRFGVVVLLLDLVLFCIAQKDRDNPNIILNAICIVSVRLADCVCVQSKTLQFLYDAL